MVICAIDCSIDNIRIETLPENCIVSDTLTICINLRKSITEFKFCDRKSLVFNFKNLILVKVFSHTKANFVKTFRIIVVIFIRKRNSIKIHVASFI